MGNWLAAVPVIEERDCTSGLSRRDIHLVRKSWKKLFENDVDNGAAIFKRLFQTDPTLKDYFPMLKDVEDAQLDHHVAFKAHVIRVMHSLNTVVVHLHEPDVVVVLLHKLGKAHQKHHVHRKDFEVFKSVVVVMFSELEFNDVTMDAWDRTIAFFFKHIFEKLDKN